MTEVDALGLLRPQSATPGSSRHADMVWIPGGTFRMGSDKLYAEEAPVHSATVDAFWIDRTPVTNREFREFVRATGHVTFAEIAPDPKYYPGALPKLLKAGSLVSSPPKHPIDDLSNWSQWWAFKFGANWRRPYGPRSSLSGRRLSENCVLSIKNKSHSVTAEIVVPEAGAEGVIIAQGANIGGWSLYAKNGKLKYCYNVAGVNHYYVEAASR